MNGLLSGLGMGVAFSGSADFTGLSPQACCIGFVQHAATLKVAEQGTVASASDETRTATVVSYLPGHGQDALQVAKALKLGSASVQRIDPSTQAIACPPPSQCAASVVVTVGADLSNQ